MKSDTTALKTCRRCGNRRAAFYFSGDICDDCKWDSWIPAGFQRLEKYVYSEVWKHKNATRRPRLEIDFLDAKARTNSLN